MACSAAGWQVYYCGASSVYHLGGATIAYAGWQQNHLLRAPFTGQVCYIACWHEGQQVKAEQELFSIIPANGSYSIKLQLPSAGYGKIAKGQSSV